MRRSSATWMASSLVGKHDQRARRCRLAAGAVDQVLQNRDREGERLAGAGPRLADDVVIIECDRKSQSLNRERLRDTCGGQRDADRLNHA